VERALKNLVLGSPKCTGRRVYSALYAHGESKTSGPVAFREERHRSNLVNQLCSKSGVAAKCAL
jgi:hypothetical protein